MKVETKTAKCRECGNENKKELLSVWNGEFVCHKKTKRTCMLKYQFAVMGFKR